MTEKYDHFFYEEIKGEYIDFHGNCSFATNDDVVALGFSKVSVPIWCRFYHSPARTAVIWSDYLIYKL